MRAVVFDGENARVVTDAPEPTPAPGFSLIRTRAAGICSTDLQIVRGYMGFRGILGHEFVGEVVSGRAGWAGRRVAGEINFACGRCATCAAGRARHCPTRTVLGILGADGAFADYVCVPDENLHEIPDSVDDTTAIFVEPLAAAFEAEEQSRAFAGGRTIVVGAGKLGSLVAQVLRRRGDRVEVVCRSASARALCEQLGLPAVAPDAVQPGADLVVEATGDASGLAAAMGWVRPRGAIVLKTTVAGEHQIDLAPLVIDEVTVIGSRCGDFAPAIDALARGEIAVAPLVADRCPLDLGVEAMRRAGEPGVLKVVLETS